MKVPKGLFIVAMIMTLVLTLSASLPVAARDGPPKITSPAVLEKLYPMSPEAEAAIVHEVPPVEFVIIDGVKYESKDVALFNGRRLHFTTGKDGQQYAFTSAEGLEKFLHDELPASGDISTDIQWGATIFEHVFQYGDGLDFYIGEGKYTFGDLNEQISSFYKKEPPVTLTLYEGIYWSGDSRTFLWGTGTPELLTIGWNDRASSGSCWIMP